MSLVVDASVAVKWLVQEDESAKARELFVREDDLFAPALIIAEVGGALWKKQRKNIVPAAQATAALTSLPQYFAQLFDLHDLGPRALELATELDHPIYDCFYLALAERERVTVVSADTKLLAAARKLKTVEARKL